MTYRIPTDRNSQPILYNYVPEIYRSFIRGMVEFVVYIHTWGKSLKSFSFDNLVVQDNVLKFLKVRFINATIHTRKADFQCIMTVMEKLFEGETITKDVDHLYSKMFSYKSSADEYLIFKHLSILSSTERVSFFKNCCDKKKSLEYSTSLKQLYGLVVQNFGNNTGWTQKKMRQIGHPGPINDCFWMSQYKDTNEYLLRFCRNMGTRLKDHIIKYQLEFYDLDIELMIMSLFDEELIKFQESLHAKSLLEHFI